MNHRSVVDPQDPWSQMNAEYADDLALARACAEGLPEAWDRFIRDYRPRLYAAARAMAGAEKGRELADSLYAELYGLEMREGSRRSLFTYYHGRSSLMTWLRAVLAQRHVDSLRVSARTRPLDEITEPAVPAAEPDPASFRRQAALALAVRRAIDALEPADRLRLAWYYALDLTLAEIARMSREHEATVSRKLSRTRRTIRDAVERILRENFRMTEAEVRECFDHVQEIGVEPFLERGQE